MAGYADTKKLIEDSLVGRPEGTLIYPKEHQAFALQMLDYIRSVELLSASTLQGIATPATVPVQPNNGRVSYIATVPAGTTYTFTNFHQQNGNSITITSGPNTVSLVTLLWNGEYWTAQNNQVQLMLNIVDGYLYAGIALPETTPNPVTPDEPCYYIAATAGTYGNFGGIVVNEGEVAFLKWNGTGWTKEVTGLASSEELSRLGKKIDGLNGEDNIIVTQGELFQHEIVVPNSGTLGFTFTGMSLFSDVVAVLDSTLTSVLLEISEDGTYEVDLQNAGGKIVFFRDAAHVVSSGTVTIGYYLPGQIEKIEDEIEILRGDITGINSEINAIEGLNNTINVPVTQGEEFKQGINVEGLSGKLKFTFTGMSLFSDVVAVLDSTLTSVLLNISEDGTYEVNIADANGKVVFFRNAPMVTSSGTVTIAYEASGIIDNKVQDAVDEVVGISNVASIPVTQGEDFQYEIVTGALTGQFRFSFEGKPLFGDVVAVYTNNFTTPSLEITADGYYEVTLNPSFGKVIFFRNAPMVTSSGTVTINYQAGGVIDDMIDGAEGNVIRTDDFMNGVTRNQKYLTRIAFLGDSLTANEVGGDIPQAVDEGNTMRPMRLLYNNIPRRFYDKASWNKPTFRRLDNSDWTKSGFSVLTGEQIFWGIDEVYHTAQSADAYAEITIPDGYEHFAIIARTKSGYGKLNVTINGSNPASLPYSNPIIDDDAVTGAINGNPKSTLIYKLENNTNVDENDCPITLPVGANQIDLGIGVGQGNPYAIFEYNNLPGGSNTIRISANDATRVDLWGIFYWTGNSMVVMNMAYGGHSTTQLLSVYRDVVFNDDVKFDSYIFEMPLMNDTAKIMDVSITKANVNTILNKLKGKDVLFTSCHPFGLSIVHDTNFYAEYSNPTMEQVSEGVRSVLTFRRKPYIDLFRIFKALILSRGGTLAGGEGGLWYTWDGQHENLAGIEIWFNNLWSILKNRPLMID